MRILIVLLLMLTFSPVKANTSSKNSSRYTSFNLSHCKVTGRYEGGSSVSYRCPGYGKEKLYVADGDLRFFIGYGKNGKKQRSASQTLSAFNTISRNNNGKTTIEWRGKQSKNRQGRKQWKRFASIIRYYTSENGKKGQTLIVTKVTVKQSCHVAYINARRPHANKLARKIADKYAQRFNCKRSPMRF